MNKSCAISEDDILHANSISNGWTVATSSGGILTWNGSTYNYTEYNSCPKPNANKRYLDDGAFDIANCMNSTKMTAKEKSQTVIKKILVNGPATIVFWGDGSKTIVKANGEDFDAEKALAMAFVKRMCGNKGSYIDILHRAMKENDLDWEVGNSEGDK